MNKKTIKNKKIYVLGVVIALGVAVAVSAGKEETIKEKQQQPMPEWGTTKAVAIEPLDVMFSHTSHVVTQGISCAECHPGPFAKEYGAAAATGDFNMAALEEGRFCGECHNDGFAFGVTAQNSCMKCHGSYMIEPKSIVFTKPVKAVYFDHEAHTVDFGLSCIDCHSQLFRAHIGYAEQRPEYFTMEAIYARQFCGSCHDGVQAFAASTRCTDCHIGVKGFRALSDAVERK